MPYSAPYSSDRDKDSSKSDHEFEKILSRELTNISKIVKCHGDDDFNGIDFKATTSEGDIVRIQKKAIEHLGFNTVTMTEKESDTYKTKKIDILFHCYYDKNSPKIIKQYVILDMTTTLELFDEFKNKRVNRSSKTDFVYVDYTCIKNHYEEYYKKNTSTYIETPISDHSIFNN